MAGKSVKLTKKQRKFLEIYVETEDRVKAYYAAGYNAKSEDSARATSYNLLRRIGETMEGRRALDEICTDIEVAGVLKRGLKAGQAKTRMIAANIVTKCKGWQKDDNAPPPGVTIIIPRRFADEIEGDAPIQVQAPQKPRQITD
jgi:hypothetical protein